jgi:two-component system, cell cycle sensor histidine kinase and response regulator CckA
MSEAPTPDFTDVASREERLMARIARLELAVGTARELPAIYRALHEFVASAAPCNGLYVSHYDPVSDQRTCVFALSEGEEQDIAQLPPMPMTNSPQSRAVRTGEVIVSDDFQAAIAGQQVVNLGLERDPRLPQSSVAVPMKIRGRIIGAFEVQSVERSAYRREHAVLLQMAGNLCAIATENIRLLQTEQRLRRDAEASELRFRALIENSADATVAFLADGRFCYVSPGATRILGYPETEFLGMNAFAIVHPDDAGELRSRFEQLLTDPTRLQYASFRCRHRDGTWHWLAGAVKNLLATEGVQALVGNFQDITERKQAEADLRASEERYRLLFENNPCMLLVFAPESRRLLAVNDAVVAQFGYSRAELLERTLDDLSVDGAGAGSETPAPIKKALVRQRRRDGTCFDAEVFTHPLRFADRAAQLQLCVDISERVRLEEQLRQMQKMESIGQLAGGVAHDFNNILTVIQARASLLLNTEASPGETRGSLREIHQAAMRAGKLTQQLLAFSRKQTLTLRVIDLNEVVRQMELMLQRMLGEDVSLVVRCAPDVGRIEGDAGLMEQALMNLAVNARDAMPRGGRLTVSTCRWFLPGAELHRAPEAAVGTEFACLSVVDTGQGIATEHLPRIFDPFFTTKDVGKGTGLGLATVYGIVRQHRGWVDVRSEIGRGSEFRILLPIVQKTATAVAAAVPSKHLPSGSETVLVVEDEDAVRTLVRSVLTACGYRVLEATNGREALAAWKRAQGAVDLVITDLIMPEGMTGSELATHLLAANPRLRLIYTSGYDPAASASTGAVAPGIVFLPKPYDAAILARTVRDRLDRA